MATELLDEVRETVIARPVAPRVRGVALVRCGKTGRPKFDRPMREYPWWAQEAFRRMLTPREVEEFFR